ncbi:MAG: HAMP domain-containing histidine kinase [Gammaproteobacteria bacterium]|nr:HAMP domain-containing histidine kinase [Gammaproteobacteria bacterium]
MRLKSSIFLWVSLATIIPLTALILLITAYSERLHRKDIDTDIQTSMVNIVNELNFRLNYEQEVVLALATSPAMKGFFPVLKRAAEGDLHPNYFDEVEKLNDFLAGFQHSVPGLDTVRVLDVDGNTLVKVRFGKHLPALFEGMEDIPLAEEELVDENFLNWMLQLEPYQLVYGQLPLSQRDFVSGQELSLLNSIIPLAEEDGRIIGFLSARALGDQLDHIMEAFPRTNRFRLTIAELNNTNQQRHGMLLYNDDANIKFNQPHSPDKKLLDLIDEELWEQIELNRYGNFRHTLKSQRFYYQEFYPYSNQLVSWLVVLQLDSKEVAAPFQRIRIGLFAFAFMALIISLILANMGARHIAEPISLFSRTLKSYADGENVQETKISMATEELKELDHSYHYLVDTLKTTEQERDRAQKMILQKAKLASIGEMAAGIGHEINNPLNNILSYTKLIERDIPDSNKDLKDDLQGLRDEAMRAGHIVRGILNFARQVPPEYTEFDLRVWLNDTLLLVKSEAHKHHVKTQLLESDDLFIEGDRNQLQQVLVNLLINAIQASEQHSVIEVCTELSENTIRIIVSDSGRGVRQQDKDKIFDPFFTTKSVGEGSGLGLSISLGIVQSHNGQLTLENNAKGGVDAIITLPLSKQSKELTA